MIMCKISRWFRSAKNNRQRASLIWPTLAVLLLSVPARADSASAKGKLTFDRYYAVELQGQRCGYVRAAVRESADRVTTLTYIRITVRQLGQDMLMVVKSLSHARPDGDFISIDQTAYTNGTEVAKTAVLEGDELVVTTTLFGQQAVERYPVPEDGFVTEAAVDPLIIPLLAKPGSRLAFTLLSLEGGLSPFMPMTMEVIGDEIIQAYGQAVSATKVAAVVTIDSIDFPSTNWCDDQGVLAMRMAVGGMDIFAYAADKEQAKKPADGASLDSISVVVPKVPLAEPAKARRATYRLTLRSPDENVLILPETDMQKVVARGQDYVDVEVIRQQPPAWPSEIALERPQEIEECLKSTLYLDWRNPAVKAAAESVAADSENPWEIALALWKYVDEAIYIKSYAVAFDPASNVLATGKGDCTEHAVLLAALLRARGLPSRVVVGLTQVPGIAGRKAIFGYHAWNEVWIDGNWISLDAALGQAPVDVSHIALGVSAVDGADPLRDVSAGLSRIMGNLDIEVLSQE